MPDKSVKITFSDRAVRRGEYRINPETGKRVYKPYVHTRLKTVDGKPLKMARVFLPDKDHRSFQFPEDKYGIDRNSRMAYIQVPQNAIKNIPTKDGKKSVSDYVYINNPNALFNVYFQSLRDKATGIYDAPDIYRANAKELKEMFPEMKAKEVEKDPKPAEKVKKEEKTKEKKTTKVKKKIKEILSK